MTRSRLVGWAVIAPVLVAPALLAQTASHYANARKYLRTAQVLMQVPPQPNVQLTLKSADEAVGEAIGDLDKGAHTGPGDGTEQLGAGANQMTEADRLKSIVDLLHSARQEIMQDTTGLTKDGGPTAEWRNNAVRHIASALDAVHRAAVAAHLDREIGSF